MAKGLLPILMLPMDPNITASIIGVTGTAIVALSVGYFKLYGKVEVNDERLKKLIEEKIDLAAEIQEIKSTIYQIRDALLRDNKI